MFVVRLIGVLFLVILNGFFAAAEFSLVAVRLSRVRQLVGKGNVRAKIVELLVADLHHVVSGVQLGITLTSLALGALGEATLANFFRSLWHGVPGTRSAILAHAFALTSAFILLSALHVVIGELVPKTVSLARAERVALLIARPFHWFLNTFRWAIDLLDRASGAIIRAMGIAPQPGHGVAHSTEELQIQIQQARERGLLAASEERVILSAIELGQVQVREIMVPRPDMHILRIEATFDEVMRASIRNRQKNFLELGKHALASTGMKLSTSYLHHYRVGNAPDAFFERIFRSVIFDNPAFDGYVTNDN